MITTAPRTRRRKRNTERPDDHSENTQMIVPTGRASLADISLLEPAWNGRAAAPGGGALRKFSQMGTGNNAEHLMRDLLERQPTRVRSFASRGIVHPEPQQI